MRGKAPVDESTLTPQEIEARVQRLTTVATNLFKRGSYQPAFESLMKAYLLDPTNPRVMDCEKTLLPALEVMRKGGLFASEGAQHEGGQNVQLARLLTDRGAKLAGTVDDHAVAAKNPAPVQLPPDPLHLLQQQRIEMLKRKAQQAKQEHEQQIWRDASKPPRVPKASQKEPPPTTETNPPSESQKIQGGLFSKFKQGKFFT